MNLLRRYPNFFLFSLALTLSGIGSSLSGVAIYELMRRQGMPPESYALMFAITFLPAFFASEVAKRLATKVKFSSVFILFNVLGVGICLANIENLTTNHAWINYATILFGGIVNGIYFPLYQILLKRTIAETDLSALSVYETIIYGLQFILGELLGTMLFSYLGPKRYFEADIVTYLVCTAIVVGLSRQGLLSFQPLKGVDPDDVESPIQMRWTRQKKLDFSINISLAAVSAPLMAIMLAHFSKFSEVSIGMLSLSPVLVGLSAKSLGQLIGPVIGGAIGLEKIATRRFGIEICTTFFFLSYAVVFLAPLVAIKLLFVFVAHVFSNIVFSIGFYKFNKGFEISEFPTVATLNYQIITAVMIGSAIWAGLLLPVGGEISVLVVSALIFLVSTVCRNSLPKEVAHDIRA